MYSKAKEQALRLLRIRPRSIKEMAQRLKQKGYRGLIIARIIEELKEKKLLDDRAFARLWIGDRLTLRPAGRGLIIKELKSKGVREEIIEAALGEFKEAYDEYETAKALTSKRADRLSGLGEERAKKRLFDFLTRRGFSYETIWRVLREIYNCADACDERYENR